jgi:hypothetical protein
MRKRRAGFGGEDSGPPPMEFFIRPSSRAVSLAIRSQQRK